MKVKFSAWDEKMQFGSILIRYSSTDRDCWIGYILNYNYEQDSLTATASSEGCDVVSGKETRAQNQSGLTHKS